MTLTFVYKLQLLTINWRQQHRVVCVYIYQERDHLFYNQFLLYEIILISSSMLCSNQTELMIKPNHLKYWICHYGHFLKVNLAIFIRLSSNFSTVFNLPMWNYTTFKKWHRHESLLAHVEGTHLVLSRRRPWTLQICILNEVFMKA